MEKLPKFPKGFAPSYCRFEKVSPADYGWFIFKATDLNYKIREGRFKNVLFKPLKKKPPTKLDWKINMMIAALDFTIEIFEYTTKDKQIFSYRRRRRIPPEQKK